MDASGTLLGSISDFCRRTGMAESTFGRRAVNDGKFVARLRDGARVTPETLNRVNQFITKHGFSGPGESPPELMPLIRGGAHRAGAQRSASRRRKRTSASSTTARSICSSSTPAARRTSSLAGSAWSSAIFIRARPRYACSTPAWATARCSRA